MLKSTTTLKRNKYPTTREVSRKQTQSSLVVVVVVGTMDKGRLEQQARGADDFVKFYTHVFHCLFLLVIINRQWCCFAVSHFLCTSSVYDWFEAAVSQSVSQVVLVMKYITVYLPNHPPFLGGSGTSSAKNLSEESSSRTYQKYCAIGMMKEPTTRTESKAVYLPVVVSYYIMERWCELVIVWLMIRG